MYADSNLKFEEISSAAKLILSLYRQVTWAVDSRANFMMFESKENYGSTSESAYLYLSTFAPERVEEKFNNRVSNVMDSKLMLLIIYDACVRLKVYPEYGEIYHNIIYICSHYNNKGDCTRHSIKEDYLLDMTLFALKDYLKKYNELLSQVNKLDVSKVTFNIDFESLNSEKRKYERLRQSLYMDLEDELITSEEFERFRKNYLIKIREIEKQIATKKNILANLQEKMKNKDSLVSEIVPTDLSSLNRLTIVSFIDRIEIGENNEINFVFNNLETVNLLKTLIKEESNNKSEVKKNLISINKVFGNALENKTPMQLAGGIL